MVKVGVFPAAGSLGSSISQHLLSLLGPEQLVLISRHPDRIQPLDGLTTRKADYDDPDTFKGAFDGISHLILISYPSLEFEQRCEVRLPES